MEFKIKSHTQKPGNVVELWSNGQFIGQITSGDMGDGHFRILTKHRISVDTTRQIVEVVITPQQ